MAAYDLPLPQPDPITQPFWDSLKAHAIQVQRSKHTGKYVFYPRLTAPGDLEDELEWQEVSGRGVVHAFAIPHIHANPAFRARAPYIVALVELDEGVRMLTNLVDVEPTPEAVKIGMPVEIVYDDVTDAITLPKFRPRQ
ncbi:MAG: Zn-ribbon domain-containing OB-fold protein [Chloroflexi bacterium]|nr:Zn-ribbon domain-containing OB-fold protein [Chloroflexota bacterium]